jgi:kojibiose phosphorylase
MTKISGGNVEIKAVIFDLDGVIVDTAKHHYHAWKRLVEELGIPCPLERKDEVRGISRFHALKIVLAGHAVSEEEAERLASLKDSYYREMICTIGPSDLLPGVRAILDDLDKRGIGIAVATVSRNAETVLSSLGILDELDVLASGNSDARSKPAPDLFLYAAAQLGIPPSECLVIEDAPAGIEGAQAAGMWAVALGPRDRFYNVRPDLILPSLEGISYEEILSFLKEEQDNATPWLVKETGFEPTRQNQSETVFTVGNGYLSTRGSLEERYPKNLPATLLSGLYDEIPIFHTELANAPDWTCVHLHVEEEPFSLHRGKVLLHERTLDLRDGILRRRVQWRSSQKQTVEIQTMRFTSMADPHLCVQLYAVTALDFDGEVKLQTWLDGKAENPGIPPFPEVGLLHWEGLSQGSLDPRTIYLGTRTRSSQTELGMATGLVLEGVPEGKIHIHEGACPGLDLTCHLRRGQTVVAVKLTTVFTSLEEKNPVKASLLKLEEARDNGYATIMREHREAWARLWEECDVRIEGDEQAQRAVRFNLYHLLIAAPRTERTSIPAKTLSGFGYRGHVFWDTDTFILPFFAFTQPEVARRALLYRYHTLAGAREKAQLAGYEGAMFAWESARDGREVTPRWVPDKDGSPIPILCGTLEHHISADVAHAVWQYWQASEDDEFMQDFGAEIILSTGRFWASRVEYDNERESYLIRHVIGPDEYHDDVDNNAFTNAMACWNLKTGLKVWTWLAERSPKKAEELQSKIELAEERIQEWNDIADRIEFHHDQETGLIEQFDGYFSLEKIDINAMEPRTRSIYDIFGPEKIRTSQAIKQPDVLMLLCLLPTEFDERTLRANWEYYESRTDDTYGSSLSPSIQAILGCKVGETENAYEHFLRATLVDLEDSRGNTVDGIHAASAGGVWQALALGFGGLRITPEGPRAWPVLPESWHRLRFSIHYHGQRFSFDLTPGMRGPIKPTQILPGGDRG